jgi:glycosyltransferase involved in cell wall biosynthesis
MRILWLNHRDIEHPSAGGAERSIQEIGRRFVKSGDQLQLISGGWKGCASHALVDGVEIRRFSGALLPHLVVPFLLQTRPLPDVVVDDLAHAIPWGSPRLSKLPGTAFFRHLHSRTLSGQVSRPVAAVLKRVERSYPSIYVTWPFVTETYQSVSDLEHIGISRERCTVIPPGVDLELFRPGTRSTRPQLVYFGGMRRYKRPEQALMAFRRLLKIRPDWSLIMIGDGPGLPALRRLASEMGFGPELVFAGRVREESLIEILRSSWVNIHCSVSEGWGLSALEAAACGVPTAGYSVPGLNESVRDGISGHLVSDGDVDALVSTIIDISEGVSRLTSSCRTYAEGFSWDRTAEAWRSHLKRLVSAGASTVKTRFQTNFQGE